MPVISNAQTGGHQFAGVTFSPLAAPHLGSRENAVWRIKIPAGSIAETAHQLSREEILVVVCGAAVATIDGSGHQVAPGDTIILPAFTDFRLDNPGDADFEAIAVLPAGGHALLPGQRPFMPLWTC
jgi:quercetin dioxygenase-like cupin family protein